eukprot:7386451-Prymnesium_polylepis.1
MTPFAFWLDAGASSCDLPWNETWAARDADQQPPRGWVNATGTAGHSQIVLSVPVFSLRLYVKAVFVDGIVSNTLSHTELTTTIVIHVSGSHSPYRSAPLSSALRRYTWPTSPGRV